MSLYDEPNHLNQCAVNVNEDQDYSDDNMKLMQHAIDPFDCSPGSVEQYEAYLYKFERERKENEFSVFCDSLNICWCHYEK